MASSPALLAETVGFELAGDEIGSDIESGLRAARAAGVVFSEPADPLRIFQKTVGASIREIETHPRGQLLRDFLSRGPYFDAGDIPAHRRSEYLEDDACAAAIRFVHGHMINCFKGAVAELLAIRPCLQLIQRLQRRGELSEQACLYVGEAVSIPRAKGSGRLEGADQHILVVDRSRAGSSRIEVAGVTEVKSYVASRARMRKQLDRHIRRAGKGLLVGAREYSMRHISLGRGSQGAPLRILVSPSTWKLSRSFCFHESDHARVLRVEPGPPPGKVDERFPIGHGEWHIRLRWSAEALANAAYEMTFWYMEKVGEIIYSTATIPPEWDGMSPADAGRNAAKMMLYYAILRARSERDAQRAIALYNSYGYGYALGMSYVNPEGKREMLWPQDLDEILSDGKTKGGCVIR